MPSGVYERTEDYRNILSSVAVERGLIKNLGNGMLGRHHTYDTKMKLRIKRLELKKKMGCINSEKTRRKISDSCKGRIPWNKGKKGVQVAWNKGKKNHNWVKEKNPNWKGGTTPFLIKFYNESGFKEIRKKIYERDMYTCQRCNHKCKGREIQCHHIIPVRLGGGNNLDNLITFCRSCHKIVEGKINVN